MDNGKENGNCFSIIIVLLWYIIGILSYIIVYYSIL